jgi:membrane associated rhomboid family serine protease
VIPLQDTRTSGHFPWQTILLIAVTVYVFYLQLTTPDPEGFIMSFALVPATIRFSDPATLLPFLTAVFLHGGFLHIISNMLFLWVFGDNVEERFGWWFLPFYLIGGVVANLGQYLLMPNSPIPILGASGAVAAVLGAYLIYFPHHHVKTLVPIFFFITILHIPAAFLLVYWFILQLFNGLISVSEINTAGGGVAYFAHIAGFLFGVLAAWIYRPNFALEE